MILLKPMRYLLLVLAILGITACSPPAETGPQEADKPRIALIMKSLANEFFATMADGARAHHGANAERYDLIVNGIKDERDLARQVALVEEMTASGVDAIVIAPADSRALIPALSRAIEAGVVVVNIDNQLDRAILQERGLSIPFVGPDNRAGAQEVGAFLAQQLSRGDAVLMLEGTRTSFNAQQRRQGFADAMQTAGVTIADSQSANWEMAPANTLATAMLAAHPQARAILAANDNMALGAMAAVRAAGRDSGDNPVLIVGFDNISAVREAMRQGRILATADQHADRLAAYGIDYALAQLDETRADVPLEDRETPVDLITASTLAGP